MSVLDVIMEEREVLFAPFNSLNVTYKNKVDAWVRVTNRAKELNLASEGRSWVFARDKLWSVWKCRTLSKLDSAKNLSAGEKYQILNEIDKKILEIIGQDSLVTSGVDIQETITYSEDTPTKPSTASSSEGKSLPISSSCGSWSAPRITVAQKRPATSAQKPMGGEGQKRLVLDIKESLKVKLLQKEMKLKEKQLESVDVDLYKTKLECLKLERELGLNYSEYTLDLALDNGADIDVSATDLTEEF